MLAARAAKKATCHSGGMPLQEGVIILTVSVNVTTTTAVIVIIIKPLLLSTPSSLLLFSINSIAVIVIVVMITSLITGAGR